TPSTSNAFVPSTSCQAISCRQFDLGSELNTVFTQEPTFLNINYQNLQILSNEDNDTFSFAINHTSANTPFMQCNHNFNMKESNIT
ncbi:1098_t:CDS:1, partial [Gigaspora rosea]